MPPVPQTYANHTRTVPIYLGVLGILTVNLGWAVLRTARAPSLDGIMGVLMAATLIMVALYARGFALTVQDRVIRLEMRLRMKDVLPASMHGRINDFTRDQLVALRFACDAELPALAVKVLGDNIQDRKAIKLMIKDWQGDYLRV